jgi:hypothetical protein
MGASASLPRRPLSFQPHWELQPRCGSSSMPATGYAWPRSAPRRRRSAATMRNGAGRGPAPRRRAGEPPAGERSRLEGAKCTNHQREARPGEGLHVGPQGYRGWRRGALEGERTASDRFDKRVSSRGGVPPLSGRGRANAPRGALRRRHRVAIDWTDGRALPARQVGHLPARDERVRGGGASASGSCCRICNNCHRREDLSSRVLQPRRHHLRRLPREVPSRHAVPHLGHAAAPRVHRQGLHPGRRTTETRTTQMSKAPGSSSRPCRTRCTGRHTAIRRPRSLPRGPTPPGRTWG